MKSQPRRFLTSDKEHNLRLDGSSHVGRRAPVRAGILGLYLWDDQDTLPDNSPGWNHAAQLVPGDGRPGGTWTQNSRACVSLHI